MHNMCVMILVVYSFVYSQNDSWYTFSILRSSGCVVSLLLKCSGANAASSGVELHHVVHCYFLLDVKGLISFEMVTCCAPEVFCFFGWGPWWTWDGAWSSHMVQLLNACRVCSSSLVLLMWLVTSLGLDFCYTNNKEPNGDQKRCT